MAQTCKKKLDLAPHLWKTQGMCQSHLAPKALSSELAARSPELGNLEAGFDNLKLRCCEMAVMSCH